MKNGLYIVNFRTPLDEASGVVVVQDETVYGGDSGMYYVGSVSGDETALQVRLYVRQHNPVTQSVFGDYTDFELKLKGSRKGDGYLFEGRADAAPSLRFEARLNPAEV
ncbi:hypothetical protein DDZ18_08000 [Marinicauda salina]|jgi:hypothetical protein|uniref:Negative regulator GrlR n=1 Tax=Marinicauda salina TaxID=2135793 RepID=A0A2U2BUD9_9PROT|nr:GrlR family regulatory protein [Marinicauda salina]PWE17599.1 hypothetical protein DDZ18_08000 [Marinicauda salina]